MKLMLLLAGVRHTDESSRVFLQPIRGLDGSDYINASFVDVSYDLRRYKNPIIIIMYIMYIIRSVEDQSGVLWHPTSGTCLP